MAKMANIPSQQDNTDVSCQLYAVFIVYVHVLRMSIIMSIFCK